LYWQLLRCFNLRRFGQSWAKNLADFVGNSSIIPTDCMSIAESRLGFLVTEAILTHAHRSIQSAHDRCIAMAEWLLSFGKVGKPRAEGLRLLLDLEEQMISGAHIIVYSKNAEADRAFFRDVLGFKSVDAGHGWLIFALPPAEAAVHPSDASGAHELYFMCDDLKVEMTSLEEKGIECSEVQEQRWGSITKMRLPGGGEVGLYQPKHPTALDLK
jgi:catechol 2,3-dioxygenase-like lactoylglutathione lyase family enzyme